MTRGRRRLLLLGLILVELAVAAAVILWVLAPPEARAPASPGPTLPAPTPTQAQPLGVWVSDEIPPSLRTAVQVWVNEQPGTLTWADGASADLAVDWPKKAGARSLAKITLVPVVAFPSQRDDVTLDELRRAWLGRARGEAEGLQLITTLQTAAALDALLGPRGSPDRVAVVSAPDLVNRLWDQPDALAILPFDQLQPSLKVLSVDGLSALDRDLDLDRYPLLAQIWVKGPNELEAALAAETEGQGLASNRHLDRLTVLAMTGVTALTRGVAYQMEARADYAWPARQIAGLLSSADLTHVSNEVSFLPGCEPELDTWVFCARPEYMETLHLVGADLVELTGNHNLDHGAAYALLSLDLYAEAGMRTFGGGRNATDAGQPLLLTHNGNRLAFLGYNQFGPDYAWATADQPGAARFSLDTVQADLARVRPQADVILVSIQHTETYEATPLPEQIADFQAVAAAGADVVTGSQAHQPQTIEFYGDTPIFYGLGNLFFDQTWSERTRQGLVVRHVVYDGRLIATEPIPTVIDDTFQTHLAPDDEAEAILQAIFVASGW